MSSHASTAPAADDRIRADTDFATIALQHLPAIARLSEILAGQSADAADLVQETFLRAYLGWHTFTIGTDVRRWLSTICRNAFLEQRKREQRSTPVDDHELESLAAAHLHNSIAGTGLDHLFTRIDLAPTIARAIAALDTHYRLAVVLVDVEGFTYEEVAETMDVPVGTIRSRLYRGRRILQEALIAHAIDAGFASATNRSGRGSRTRQAANLENRSLSECEAAVRQMWTYLDKQLPPAVCAHVTEHLDACVECASHFGFATEFLRALAAAPLFGAFDQRIQSRVASVLASAGFSGRSFDENP